MINQFCTKIDIDYAISVWSGGLAESILVLGIPPSELLGMPIAEFNNTVRAFPLETLDVISLGDEEEYRAGMDRVPDDVFAQLYSLTYGIDAAEFLREPVQDRPAFLLTYGEVPFEIIQALSAYQLNEYYVCLADGLGRPVSAARAMNAPLTREDDCLDDGEIALEERILV